MQFLSLNYSFSALHFSSVLSITEPGEKDQTDSSKDLLARKTTGLSGEIEMGKGPLG